MAKNLQLTKETLTKALNKKRFAWVDSVMKEQLPTDIYGSMHSANPSDKLRATRWLHEQGWHVVDLGDGLLQIFRGTKMIQQTKMVLELTDPDEVLAIMETVTDNVNIPRPPWLPKVPESS